MEVKNLKDLSNLMKLMRKQGVEQLDLGSIRIVLGQKPETKKPSRSKKIDQSPDDIAVDDPFTGEDVLFWSSAGLPAESN